MPEEIFILIIVAIAALLLVIRAGLKHDKDIRIAKYAAQAPRLRDDREDRDMLAAKVARLEQRLAVLEEITTDPSHRLAAEIDGLGRIEAGRERTSA
jgi:hypothetical protein